MPPPDTEIVMRPPHPGDPAEEGEALLGEPITPDGGPPPTSRGGSRPIGVLVGSVLVVAGLTAVHLGASGLRAELVMGARVALALAGVAATYAGAARVIRAVWGPRVDVAYWFAVGWLVVLVAAAVLAPWLPLGEAEDSAKTLTDPILARPELTSENPLGTNRNSLDLLSRVIYGARVSLTVSLVAAGLGMVVGGAFGLVSGYLRGAADTAIGIATNVLLAFPPLVLLLALAAVLPRTARNQALALAILVIPVNVRLARASAMSFAQREFVAAARAMGATRWRIMVRELLPNVVVPLISYGFLVIASLIVAEASLSFLGLGLPQPSPTWGNMIAEGRGGTFEESPHILFVPATALFLTVLSFNLVGERLRKRWAGGKQVEL